MKAISLLQPWASLLCAGIKTVETRKYQTEYRGTVYIHAGERGMPLTKEMADVIMETVGFPLLSFATGGIIGKVDIRDCIPAEEWVGDLKAFGMRNRLARERVLGDLSEGRFVWVVDKPVLFEKIIHCEGGSGFWELDPVTQDALRYSTAVRLIK